MTIDVVSHEEDKYPQYVNSTDTKIIWMYKLKAGTAVINSKRGYTRKSSAVRAAIVFRDKYFPSAVVKVKEVL